MERKITWNLNVLRSYNQNGHRGNNLNFRARVITESNCQFRKKLFIKINEIPVKPKGSAKEHVIPLNGWWHFQESYREF